MHIREFVKLGKFKIPDNIWNDSSIDLSYSQTTDYLDKLFRHKVDSSVGSTVITLY